MKEGRNTLLRRLSNIKQAGFTLLEIVVVLVLMSITAGISVIGLDRLIASYRFSGATRELARQFQLARAKAVMEKVNFGLYIDFNQETYVFFRDNNGNSSYDSQDFVILKRNLSSSIDLLRGCFDICAGAGYNSKQLNIIFFQDGSSNGSGENYIVVGAKKFQKNATIYVRSSTGRVKIEGL